MKHIYNPKQPVDVPTPYVVVTLLVDDVIINTHRFVSSIFFLCLKISNNYNF